MPNLPDQWQPPRDQSGDLSFRRDPDTKVHSVDLSFWVRARYLRIPTDFRDCGPDVSLVGMADFGWIREELRRLRREVEIVQIKTFRERRLSKRVDRLAQFDLLC